MRKLIVKFGLIAGVIVSVMLLFTFSEAIVDFKYGELLGYASMILAFSTIFVATQSYRDTQLGGTISFGNALKIGLGITLIATVVYILSWMVISETIAKDFMTEYYQHSIEEINASGLSEAEINAQIAEVESFHEMYKNPIINRAKVWRKINFASTDRQTDGPTAICLKITLYTQLHVDN